MPGRLIILGRPVEAQGLVQACNMTRTVGSAQAGEVLTMTYNAQGLPETLTGTNTYLSAASYSPLGQIESLSLGNGLTPSYSYFSAELGNNRLSRILVGSLLDLSYGYDLVGNVTVITDTANSSQVQSFGYDALDRLTGAGTTSAGQGQYQRRYAYDTVGNISSRSELSATSWITNSYYYSDTDHVHAVTGLSNGWEFEYDMNGNMIERDDGSGDYEHGFDVENRLVAVTDTVTLDVTQFVYDGSGTRVLTLWPDGRRTAFVGEHYEVERSGDDTVSVQGSGSVDSTVDEQNASTNYGGSTSLQVAKTVLPGQGGGTAEKHALLSFDLSGISSSAEVESATLTLYCQKGNPASGLATEVYTVTATWDESTVTWNNKPTVASGDPVDSFTPSSTSMTAYELDLTDLVQAWVDGSVTNYGVVLQPAATSDNRSMTCASSENGTAGQRPELEVELGSSLVYRSYYYLGSQRIALRVQDGEDSDVYWFHTDHLGSTSLLSTITGTLVVSSTARHLPFGDYRLEPESDLTDVGFTGHRHNDQIGLVFMRARFYVAYLNRFVQPDTIIPNPTDPQSFNRYSYSLNNPTTYSDPSGHCIDGVSTWACIIAGVAAVAKIIDWGWTAWDTYQSGRVLADPSASRAAKIMAGLNVTLGALFEIIEPDELLPVGLPADDVARRAVMDGAQEAFEEGGEEALERFIRDSLGDQADDVLAKIGLGTGFVDDVFASPGKYLDSFTTPSDIQNYVDELLASGNWEMGTLGRGSHQGEGMVLREVAESGGYTGRNIQWHPGGGHHGPEPYWKISSPEGGIIRIGPQFQ